MPWEQHSLDLALAFFYFAYRELLGFCASCAGVRRCFAESILLMEY